MNQEDEVAKRLCDRPYVDNGYVDVKTGRLTPAGHQALEEHIRVWDNPIALLKTMNPRLGSALMGVFVNGRDPVKDAIQEYVQWLHLDWANAIRYFDPSRGVRLDTYLNFWVLKVANQMIGMATRQMVTDHCSIYADDDRGMRNLRSDVDVSLASREEQTSGAREEFMALVKVLPLPMRELMAMRFVDELSLRDIGERLGITHQRVDQLERRCLMRLRNEFRPKKAGPKAAATLRTLSKSRRKVFRQSLTPTGASDCRAG